MRLTWLAQKIQVLRRKRPHCWCQTTLLHGSVVPAILDDVRRPSWTLDKVPMSSSRDGSACSVMKCDVCIRKELYAECRVVAGTATSFHDCHEVRR